MVKKEPNDLKDIIAKNIKAHRLRLGLTQAELADRCDFQVQYVSRLETVPQNVSVDILVRVAAGLEVSIIELVGEIQQPRAKIRAIESFDHALDLLKKFRAQVI